MKFLMSRTQNRILIPRLGEAISYWQRSKGLLGTRALALDQGLWVHRCNSIHTFFMNYPIDVVFLNKDLRVVATKENIAAFRLTVPVWQARSVVELAAGQISALGIRVGEELHVGT